MLDEKLKEMLSGLSAAELLKVNSYVDACLEELASPGVADEASDDNDLLRRKYRRFECNFGATYIRHSAGPGRQTDKAGAQEATVQDISQGGLKMMSESPMAVGELLTLFLKSKERIEKKVFAEVRRCVDQWSHFEVGLMFVSQEAVISALRQKTANQSPS